MSFLHPSDLTNHVLGTLRTRMFFKFMCFTNQTRYRPFPSGNRSTAVSGSFFVHKNFGFGTFLQTRIVPNTSLNSNMFGVLVFDISGSHFGCLFGNKMDPICDLGRPGGYLGVQKGTEGRPRLDIGRFGGSFWLSLVPFGCQIWAVWSRFGGPVLLIRVSFWFTWDSCCFILAYLCDIIRPFFPRLTPLVHTSQ